MPSNAGAIRASCDGPGPHERLPGGVDRKPEELRDKPRSLCDSPRMGEPGGGGSGDNVYIRNINR